MSKSMVGAAGGLSATDRAKLIPENIREGVTLFAGTSKEVSGNLQFPQYFLEATCRNDGSYVVVVAVSGNDGTRDAQSGLDSWVPTPKVSLPAGKYRVVYERTGNTLNSSTVLALTGANVSSLSYTKDTDFLIKEITVSKSATVKFSSNFLIYPTGSGFAHFSVGFYKIS